MPRDDYGNYDVVLLPTFLQVEAWRKQQALQRESGLFGPTVTTFNAWVADLWELHGDGRTLVDSVQRAMLMRVAFAQISEPSIAFDKGEFPVQDDEGEVSDNLLERFAAAPAPVAAPDDALTLTPGLSEMAARCENRAAGISEFDDAVRMADEGVTAPGFSLREQLFLRGIAHYRRLLRQLGLIEPGAAYRELSQNPREVFPRAMRVLVDDAAPLDWRMQRFFAACGLEVEVRLADGADGIHRLPAGVQPRFAFPSGRYATAAVVMQLLDDLQPGEQAVIASPDPLALYRQIEPALARQGLVGAVQGQADFSDTDFGRTYLLVEKVLHESFFDVAALADVMRSPFAGFTVAQARDYDALLRANRLANRQECLDELCGASDDFAALLALSESDDFDGLIEHFEAMARELPGRSPAWRGEQLTALAGLRVVGGLSRTLGATWRDRTAVLERLVVSVPFEGLVKGGADQPSVLVTTQGAAARLGAHSYAMLIAADLTTDSFPLADEDDVAATLFEKLHLVPAEDALARARRTFAALMKVPSRSFVCLRPLNDANGDPAYACAMLQEFVDAYREGAVESKGSCDPDDLPAELLEGMVERGEEFLFSNSQAAYPDMVQGVAASPVLEGAGLHGDVDSEQLLPPRRFPDGQEMLRLSPSPSQVELYLECPYKWFVTRRLGLGRLEEGFGPLEKGTFAHAVLERFYRRYQQERGMKLTQQDIAEARIWLQEEADAIASEMLEEQPGSGRLVAANVLEEHGIEQLKRQLGDFLEYECELLPGFHPAYFEYSFEGADAPEYAGCKMVGTVDRIDVDDKGHAVIIDYKGSVNREHDIAGKDATHAGKVQTRIYAQMVKRQLGLDVVGALYVSYGKRHAVAGAVDGRLIETPHLPGAHGGDPWCAPNDAAEGEASTFAELSFTQMLDVTEAVVAKALEGMRQGRVEPNPATKEACQYCDADQCPWKEA